ncbi:hypothetical protein J6590_012635 [Homalodisca vitripennis]|nr:hypothetical protein J6590_012635 [Homalodisca vitripennis]
MALVEHETGRYQAAIGVAMARRYIVLRIVLHVLYLTADTRDREVSGGDRSSNSDAIHCTPYRTTRTILGYRHTRPGGIRRRSEWQWRGGTLYSVSYYTYYTWLHAYETGRYQAAIGVAMARRYIVLIVLRILGYMHTRPEVSGGDRSGNGEAVHCTPYRTTRTILGYMHTRPGGIRRRSEWQWRGGTLYSVSYYTSILGYMHTRPGGIRRRSEWQWRGGTLYSVSYYTYYTWLHAYETGRYQAAIGVAMARRYIVLRIVLHVLYLATCIRDREVSGGDRSGNGEAVHCTPYRTTLGYRHTRPGGSLLFSEAGSHSPPCPTLKSHNRRSEVQNRPL